MGIISKVHPVRSHSNAAQGGINAALQEDDSWESHAFDTIKGSDYLADQDAVEIMCRAAPRSFSTSSTSGSPSTATRRASSAPRLRRRLGRPHLLRRRHHRPGDHARPLRAAKLMKYSVEVDRYEEWFTTGLAIDDGSNCVRRDLPQRPRRLDGGLRRQGGDPGDGRQWPGLATHHQRPDLHRGRDRDGLPGEGRS